MDIHPRNEQLLQVRDIQVELRLFHCTTSVLLHFTSNDDDHDEGFPKPFVLRFIPKTTCSTYLIVLTIMFCSTTNSQEDFL